MCSLVIARCTVSSSPNNARQLGKASLVISVIGIVFAIECWILIFVLWLECSIHRLASGYCHTVKQCWSWGHTVLRKKARDFLIMYKCKTDDWLVYIRPYNTVGNSILAKRMSEPQKNTGGIRCNSVRWCSKNNFQGQAMSYCSQGQGHGHEDFNTAVKGWRGYAASKPFHFFWKLNCAWLNIVYLLTVFNNCRNWTMLRSASTGFANFYIKINLQHFVMGLQFSRSNVFPVRPTNMVLDCKLYCQFLAMFWRSIV